MTPTVTVVIPTVHERAALLDEAVHSAHVAMPHAQVRVVYDLNRRGPAAARNAAVRRLPVRGSRWLLFLDDDDLLLPHYWSIVEPELSTSDVVYTAWCLTGAVDPVPHPVFDADLLRQRNFIPVTAMVRRAMFEKVGGFDESAVLEDHALWLALLAAGARFTYVPVTGWRYRRHPGSRTDTESNR